MPDKKLTDNEIVKALECCSSGSYGCENGCPLDKECDSPIRGSEKIMKLALDLINRLQAENEDLQDLMVKYNGDFAKQEAEIERLKDNGKLESENIILNALIEMKNDTISTQMKVIDALVCQLKTAKAEAYKECIALIKEKAFAKHKTLDNEYLFEFDGAFLDNLLKEKVGEDK